ncbi:phytase [uncultured Kordia sp.]|uniref:phytase n=1 Tax=uncultured Kordia sp. TaxID=507699 RepID=UPI00260897E3|nr:phytase [uncultured Kordia sp.]
MNKIIGISLVLLTFLACKKNEEKAVTQKELQIKENTIKSVYATMETAQVSSSDDAADDSCIWIHPTNVMESKIIGTNKQEGLVVYNLLGEQVFQYPIGRVNNVDIREGFVLNNDTVALVTASNRTSNTITVHKVNNTDGSLVNVAAKPLKSNLPEIYGLGMYKSPKTNKIYVIANGKEGNIEQWELFEEEGKVSGKIVRTFAVGSQTEGVVADDYHGNLYIGEEEKALWKYDAEPDGISVRKAIVATTDTNMQADFEGVTLYDKGNGEGYIILSSQGNNSYAVFDRITNAYIGSFSIVDGAEIDGTYDTDGIDVTSVAFGTTYPKGFFVAQDGANTKGKDSLNQNFKLVDWKVIEKALSLNKK